MFFLCGRKIFFSYFVGFPDGIHVLVLTLEQISLSLSLSLYIYIFVAVSSTVTAQYMEPASILRIHTPQCEGQQPGGNFWRQDKPPPVELQEADAAPGGVEGPESLSEPSRQASKQANKHCQARLSKPARKQTSKQGKCNLLASKQTSKCNYTTETHTRSGHIGNGDGHRSCRQRRAARHTQGSEIQCLAPGAPTLEDGAVGVTVSVSVSPRRAAGLTL